MPSIVSVGLLALAGLSAAQTTAQNNYPYTIDPNSVAQSDRDAWCTNQKAQCPLICLQQPGVETMDTISNDCDPDTLTYSCVCDNDVSPNITMYTQTLPYYICTAWGNQCVANCGLGNNDCSNACRADHPCGAQVSKPPNSTLLSTMSSTTMAATATGGNNAASTTVGVDGFLGATATSTSNKKGAASTMLDLGNSYGLAVVFASVFAGFAIML